MPTKDSPRIFGTKSYRSPIPNKNGVGFHLNTAVKKLSDLLSADLGIAYKSEAISIANNKGFSGMSAIVTSPTPTSEPIEPLLDEEPHGAVSYWSRADMSERTWLAQTLPLRSKALDGG